MSQCSKCIEKCKSNENFISHIRTVHALSDTFECPENNCPRRYNLMLFYVPPARKLIFTLQLRVAQCCVLRYRGMKCKN